MWTSIALIRTADAWDVINLSMPTQGQGIVVTAPAGAAWQRLERLLELRPEETRYFDALVRHTIGRAGRSGSLFT